MWESERQGPLNDTIGAHFGKFNGTSFISCFCTHCVRKAAEQGINVARAREGYLALDRWVKQTLNQPRASDGSFVTLWRLFLEYPEILAWQRFWFKSQEEVYGLIYGTVKEANPKAQVGWHIMHLVTMSPFYRAEQDYSRLMHVSDFIKPCPYNNCAGPALGTVHQERSVHRFSRLDARRGSRASLQTDGLRRRAELQQAANDWPLR